MQSSLLLGRHVGPLKFVHLALLAAAISWGGFVSYAAAQIQGPPDTPFAVPGAPKIAPPPPSGAAPAPAPAAPAIPLVTPPQPAPAPLPAPAPAPAPGPSATAPAAPAEIRHHALSLVGEPKFGADFKNFDWANPDAPKGGRIRQFGFGSYDNLNPVTDNGVGANGLGLIFDQLMADSPDEPSTEYGLVAEWVSYPADYSSVTFKLRDEARFHDGKPITPEDVIFSLDAVKKASPRQAFYYKNVVKAEKVGEREVKFTFDRGGNRELPVIVGQLVVLPKHYWEGKDASGKARDVTKTTMETPLGSGPYKIKTVDAGRSITYERVKEYWAKDLPVYKGQWNFDEVQYQYFRDRDPAFEEFKSGKLDLWVENMASAWATRYDFDALKKGLVKKEALPHKRVAGMQGFAFNLRRKQFQDIRVRKAFALAYNFEEANKNLFYGLYVRTGSYFDNSELKATGLPQGAELDVLNSVKNDVPPEVFTTEFKNPVNDDPATFRKHLQEAAKLLEEAGWKVREEAVEDGSCGFVCKAMRSVGLGSERTERVVRNAAGETLDVEFLLASPDFERIVLPYIQNLKSLGVNARARIVDTAQYQRRENTRDFDIIVENFGQSHSPGNEQRDYWGSAAAKTEASRNTTGVSNPALDKIIDRIVFAKDREELVAATRALDRVLLASYLVVPNWHYPFDRIAYWDIFGRTAKQPSQAASPLQTWWIDAGKQKALQR